MKFGVIFIIVLTLFVIGCEGEERVLENHNDDHNEGGHHDEDIVSRSVPEENDKSGSDAIQNTEKSDGSNVVKDAGISESVDAVDNSETIVEKPSTKEFTIEAFQFGYEPDVIEVNQGDTVVIHASSRDVGHGLMIREYGINMKLRRDTVVTETFVADKVGEFEWFCSVPCGSGHGGMEGKLIVK